MASSRPNGLIAKTGLELLTFGTPNGHKISILLEELKAFYKLEYVYQSINIMENIQKEKWFTDLCPNGRIPVLIDHNKGGFAIFEGAAILQYLTRFYDPKNEFNFAPESLDFSVAEQWVAFQHGGSGPMQGQANHFFRLAKERIPYPTQRYVGETERLYGVLDARLEHREYLAGPGQGKYSIADIANFSWVNVAYFAGVNLKQFPHLEAWTQRINARPAVSKGTAIPSVSRIVNEQYLTRLESEDGFKEAETKLAQLRDEAKKQYGYKYSSP